MKVEIINGELKVVPDIPPINGAKECARRVKQMKAGTYYPKGILKLDRKKDDDN